MSIEIVKIKYEDFVKFENNPSGSAIKEMIDTTINNGGYVEIVDDGKVVKIINSTNWVT